MEVGLRCNKRITRFRDDTFLLFYAVRFAWTLCCNEGEINSLIVIVSMLASENNSVIVCNLAARDHLISELFLAWFVYVGQKSLNHVVMETFSMNTSMGGLLASF